MAYAALPNEKVEQGPSEHVALLQRPGPEPRMQLTRPIQDGKFTTGLFDCCEVPGGAHLCLFTSLLHYWQLGLNVETLEPELVMCGGNFWGGCCLSYWLLIGTNTVGLPFYLPYYLHVHRSIAKKYGIQSNVCQDCMAAWCCPLCLICQDAREIMVRENATMSPLGFAWPSPKLRR